MKRQQVSYACVRRVNCTWKMFCVQIFSSRNILMINEIVARDSNFPGKILKWSLFVQIPDFTCKNNKDTSPKLWQNSNLPWKWMKIGDSSNCFLFSRWKIVLKRYFCYVFCFWSIFLHVLWVLIACVQKITLVKICRHPYCFNVKYSIQCMSPGILNVLCKYWCSVRLSESGWF